MNEKAVHSVAVLVVLCLVLVVASGLWWHFWHSWGKLIVANLALFSFIAVLVRKVIRF